MLIALIDDGIDLRRCPDICLKDDLIVEPDGILRPRSEADLIRTSHGTTCAQIIHKYAPDAEFCSLAIFLQPKLRTSPAQLLAALEWCLEKGIPLIHMSAGTTQLCDQEMIRKVVAKLIQQGQTIVAARSNDAGRYTVPACCAGVLGAAADPALVGGQVYVRDAVPDDVQIFASSRHDLSAYPRGKVETAVSNSYAAPTVTAKVHALLSSGWKPVPELYCALAGEPVSIARMRPDFLSLALVFAPNSRLATPELLEFHMLAEFSSEQEFLAAAERETRAVAVLLPPLPSSEQFWSELFRCSKGRSGIVCACEASESLRKGAPCLFWDEGERKFLMSTQMEESPMDPEVSVIKVEPHGETSLLLLCGLRDRLTREGYGCIAVTDHPMAYLYGLEYLPWGCSPELLVSHLCQTHQPDVVLSSCSCATPELPCELQIKFGLIDSISVSEDVILLPENLSESDVEAVFQFLLDESEENKPATN